MEASHAQSESPRRRGYADVVLAVAILVGLVRFFGLGRYSLWFDEVLTPGDAEIHLAGERPTNWLGYALVRWTVAALGVGPTEGALRFLPALFGWLAVPLTAWAFRPLAGARRSALAALVVALSAWQIQWSQTARFYTMAEVSVLLGTGLVLRGLFATERARPLPMVVGVAVGLTSLLFHEHGLIVLGVTGVVLAPVVWRHGDVRLRRTLGVGGALVVVAGLVVAWPRWQAYAYHKAVSDPLMGARHFVLSLGAFITPALGAAAFAATVLGARRSAHRLAIVLGVAFGTGLVLLVLASQVTVSAQYAFSLFPWIALLAAWPVGDRDAPRRTWAWTGLLTLPLLATLTLYFTAEAGQRPRWREAVRFVHERRAPTDVVAALPAAVVEFYLFGGRETLTRRHDGVVDLDYFAPRRAIELAESGRTVWYVIRRDYLQRLERDDRRAVERFFAEECRRAAVFPVYIAGRDLAIEVWRTP